MVASGVSDILWRERQGEADTGYHLRIAMEAFEHEPYSRFHNFPFLRVTKIFLELTFCVVAK